MPLVPRAVPALLDPSNCVLVLADYQPQMIFGVGSQDAQTLLNNTAGLARAAAAFAVPTIITSVAAQSFSGPVIDEITEVFPDEAVIDRTTMNCWEDERVVDAVRRTGRTKVVLAGLWTEVCVALPALDAMREGYEVYVVCDACGGVSLVAHDLAIERMTQAGAMPITWLQFLLELQRDWARRERYDAVLEVVERHAGAYGVGVQYAHAMLGARAGGGL
jgi:nicotinamidase-related amidase